MFVAGAMSGIAEGISIQPLELLKTRFQIHTGTPLRVLPTLREIVKEGGLVSLYRGGLPEITGLVPRATAALSTLEFSRRTFRRMNDGKLSTPAAYLSGSLSGFCESFAFAPFQVIKVRLMAKEHLGRYKNTLDCLMQVLRQEGPAALLIGLGPTLWRNCVWNGLYYGTMHQLEERVMTKVENPALQALRTVAVGMAVGMGATCFNAPFDVVKSRFQSQLPHQRTYRYTLPSLYHIYKEEGPRALYRGFVPKALRLGIGQTIGLVVFQNALKAFGVAEEEADA